MKKLKQKYQNDALPFVFGVEGVVIGGAIVVIGGFGVGAIKIYI